jgi:hypothetical protein
VAPSLTRGRVCNLLVQLLLGLARAVTLGSKYRRTHDHILLSHLRLPQPGGPGPRIYIPQETGWPSYTPGHCVPFFRLLRLAGMRWRYSNPPPHGEELNEIRYLRLYIFIRRASQFRATDATDSTDSCNNVVETRGGGVGTTLAPLHKCDDYCN